MNKLDASISNNPSNVITTKWEIDTNSILKLILEEEGLTEEEFIVDILNNFSLSRLDAHSRHFRTKRINIPIIKSWVPTGGWKFNTKICNVDCKLGVWNIDNPPIDDHILYGGKWGRNETRVSIEITPKEVARGLEYFGIKKKTEKDMIEFMLSEGSNQ